MSNKREWLTDTWYFHMIHTLWLLWNIWWYCSQYTIMKVCKMLKFCALRNTSLSLTLSLLSQKQDWKNVHQNINSFYLCVSGFQFFVSVYYLFLYTSVFSKLSIISYWAYLRRKQWRRDWVSRCLLFISSDFIEKSFEKLKAAPWIQKLI